MAGLYDDTPGLSDGTGLYRGRLGLFSGASGLINGSGGAYIDLYFSLGTYSVSSSAYTTLGSIPGWSFTRASLAMGYDATGKLTYGPNNLMLQSQTFGTTWSQIGVTVTSDAIAAPDGTLTADKIMEVAAASTPRISQACTGLVGSVNVFSVYAKTAERNQIRLVLEGSGLFSAYFNTDTGVASGVGGSCTATMTSVGNGWYRCSVTWTAATTAFAPYIATASGGSTIASGDNTKGIYLWGAQLEAVTYQTTPSTYYPTTSAAYYGPRLVYDPVTLASLGILVEEARTNLCLQSQDFATTWSGGGGTVTVTVNATTSPDGTSNADLVTSSGSITLNQSIVLAATTCTFSIYAKKSTGATQANRFGIRNSTTATNLLFITFNYDTGAITYDTGASGATATNVGNGWWRIELTVSSGITSGNTVLPYVGFVGSATSGQAAYFYQGQLEAAVGASSPIPTTTAAVTRAADNARLTGLSLAYPVSLAAAFIKNFGTSTGRAVTLYIDGNNFTAFGMNSTPAPKLEVAQGGSYQAQITGSTTANGTAVSAAARVATDSVGFAVGGALIGTDVSATMPSAPTAINIGMFSDGGTEPLNGTISRIRVYKTALSDAQLQSLTS